MYPHNVGMSAAGMFAHDLFGASPGEVQPGERLEVPFLGSAQRHARLAEALCNSEFRPTRNLDLDRALDAPILLCELHFGDSSWEQVIALIRSRQSATLLIVVGDCDPEVWSAMLSRGIFDIVGDCGAEKLEHTLRTAYRRRLHQTENARLRKSAPSVYLADVCDNTAALYPDGTHPSTQNA